MTSLCLLAGWQSAARVHRRATRVPSADADSACLVQTVRHLASAAGATARDTANACGGAEKETDHAR